MTLRLMDPGALESEMGSPQFDVEILKVIGGRGGGHKQTLIDNLRVTRLPVLSRDILMTECLCICTRRVGGTLDRIAIDVPKKKKVHRTIDATYMYLLPILCR